MTPMTESQLAVAPTKITRIKIKGKSNIIPIGTATNASR